MINYKRLICFILTVAMCMGLGVNTYAIDEDTAGIIMFADDSVSILNEYQNEIAFIENYTGTTIDEINSVTLHLIRTAIITFELNGLETELRFEELQNSIVDAMLEMKTVQANSARAGSTVNHVYTRMNSGSEYVHGTYITELAVGESYSVSNSYSFSANTQVKIKEGTFTISPGFTIARTVTKTYQGPSSTDTLSNGNATTQHIIFKAINGFVVKHEYDYINEYGQISHLSQYEIEDGSREVIVFTAYASSLANAIQVENASRNAIKTYSSWSTIKSAIAETPGNFISSVYAI